MKYDVIIIGGGLGGLVAGAKLAREGKSVFLVEQHDRPGGCATTFTRKGFTLEVGLHEMDGLNASDMKTRIFRDLGVTDEVQFLKVPEFYRFVNGRQDVVISHNPDEVSKTLTSLFPAEAEGIKAYFYQLMNIRRIMKQSGSMQEKSLGEFLDSIIASEDLKLILLGNLGYFHDDPYSLSLTYYSMAQSSYYSGGGSFIQGGSQVLSNYLAGFINTHGGKVLLNHLVTEILVDQNRAAGIRYRKTSGKSSPDNLAFCEDVIANASIPQVAGSLLPRDIGNLLKENIHQLKPGASLLTVYFGFKTEIKNLGNPCYSTFVFDESVRSMADILANNQSDYQTRSFTFVDYSQIDSGLAPEGKSVGAICCIDYTSEWEGMDRKAYKRKKDEVAGIFISRLEKLIPGIQQSVEYSEVGTALTVRRYTLNPNGSVYGFAHTPDQINRNVQSPLENLHFASAWTKTGGGYSGVIFSGYLCAMSLLRQVK